MVLCVFAPYKLAQGPTNGPMHNIYSLEPVVLAQQRAVYPTIYGLRGVVVCQTPCDFEET